MMQRRDAACSTTPVPLGLSLHRAPLTALVCAVALLVPLPPAAGVPGAQADISESELAKVERAIRSCANSQRRAAGLRPLRASGVLSQAARLHARNMAVHRFFSHTDQRGRGPAERVEIFDSEGSFDFIGENIAAGYSSARLACRGWMNSPGHRANILREGFTSIGTGFARGGSLRRYYVQVFGREALSTS